MKRINTLLRAKTKGQSMMVVGLLLGLGVLIGLVAIAFDGGSALLQRRVMQNASDAGAQAGATLLSNSVAPSCVPSPCHTTFLVTNSEVWSQVTNLAVDNRQGTTGAASTAYSLTLEYHYMAGAPSPCGDCYVVAANDGNFVPDYVDGLRVTSKVNNPTTFARAVTNPITSLGVSATTAERLYATCEPTIPPGAPLPFTRFRPSLEYDISQNPNDPYHPFVLWTSQGDMGGNWKNIISLNMSSFHPTNATSLQLLTPDLRNGPAGSGAGLYPYGGGWPSTSCPLKCADMRGTGDSSNSALHTDVPNWLAWSWQGAISLTTQYPDSYMTRYPADNTTNFGRNTGNTSLRLGDWAETDYNGDSGNNIAGPLHDLVSTFGDPNAPLSYKWGKAITRTVYVWGEPWNAANTDQDGSYDDHGKGAQVSTSYNPCPKQNPCPETVWQDSTVTGQLRNNGPSFNGTFNRVHFTHYYTMIFYEATLGSNSQANGFLVNPAVPGPQPGSCPSDWEPGGGVYVQPIDP